jgi:ribonuclease Y
MPYVVCVLIGLIVGAGVVFVFLQFVSGATLARARQEADQLRETARKTAENEAKSIELTARQERIKAKEEAEREAEKVREELKSHDARLTKREDVLDRKLDTLSVKEKNLDDLEAKLATREKQVVKKEEELSGVLREQRERLLQITNLSIDQAKEMLLRRVEDECRAEAGQIVQRMTEQAQEEGKEKK